MKNKFIEFITKYDILYIFIILIFAISGFILFYGNIYSPYSDIGREFYAAQQITNGNVLYKDIFNVYAPLGYQINAIALLMFGNKLNTFYLAGFTGALANVFAIFFIAKEYTNKNTAISLSLFILSSCVFFPSISNYITPYSYSIVYAAAAFLWALYFFVKFIKTSKLLFLFLSCILTGFSAACKYEFSGFIIVIFLYLIYTKTSFKNLFFALFSMLIFPVISVILLFAGNISINDLILGIKYTIMLSKSFSVHFFYYYSGFIPSSGSLKNALLSILYPHFPTLFNSFGYLISIIFLYSAFKTIFKRNTPDKDEICILVLITSAFAVSIKCIGCISLEIYGTYFLPIILTAVITIIYKKFPKSHQILSIICLLLFISYSIYDINCSKNFKEVETQKGIIKINNIFYDSTKELISYIKNNTKSSDKILILPEGSLINYLTGRNSDKRYYYLIPPNVEIFTQEEIIQDLNNKNTEYIIISNLQYQWFNQSSFYKSWGKDIFEFIKKKYILECIIGEKFKLYVYKNPKQVQAVTLSEAI